MLKQNIGALAKKLFGIMVFRNSLPKGMDPFHEISLLANHYSIAIDNFFDVGANVGQSTLAFKEHFPDSKVHAFEPIDSTIEELKTATSTLNDIKIHPIALGAEMEEREVILGTRSDLFSLNQTFESGNKQRIKIKTLDSILKDMQNPCISVLKIDTEGHDLRVLEGAQKTLDAGRIEFIQVETTMLPDNGNFIHINDFTDFLDPLGYDLMSICNQEGWHIRAPLVYCNALFLKRRDWYS